MSNLIERGEQNGYTVRAMAVLGSDEVRWVVEQENARDGSLRIVHSGTTEAEARDALAVILDGAA